MTDPTNCVLPGAKEVTQMRVLRWEPSELNPVLPRAVNETGSLLRDKQVGIGGRAPAAQHEWVQVRHDEQPLRRLVGRRHLGSGVGADRVHGGMTMPAAPFAYD